MIYIVMVDSGDAEGRPTHALPVRAFEFLESANAFAQERRERPEGATFWIPPASVEVLPCVLEQA